MSTSSGGMAPCASPVTSSLTELANLRVCLASATAETSLAIESAIALRTTLWCAAAWGGAASPAASASTSHAVPSAATGRRPLALHIATTAAPSFLSRDVCAYSRAYTCAHSCHVFHGVMRTCGGNDENAIALVLRVTRLVKIRGGTRTAKNSEEGEGDGEINSGFHK